MIWDNRCVMHRADHDDAVGDRVMRRGTVVDDAEWACSRGAAAGEPQRTTATAKPSQSLVPTV